MYIIRLRFILCTAYRLFINRNYDPLVIIPSSSTKPFRTRRMRTFSICAILKRLTHSTPTMLKTYISCVTISNYPRPNYLFLYNREETFARLHPTYDYLLLYSRWEYYRFTCPILVKRVYSVNSLKLRTAHRQMEATHLHNKNELHYF